jgi:hypothetical protein
MIIRIEKAKANHPQFVNVEFSLPCSESPKWLSEESSVQKFRLVREKGRDSVLKEFRNCIDESAGDHAEKPCPSMLMWKRPPSTENVALPFGQVVPAYRSADLPLAPVL